MIHFQAPELQWFEGRLTCEPVNTPVNTCTNMIMVLILIAVKLCLS